MIEDPQLYQLFKVESAEHLARLDDGLLRLEKSPTDGALLEEVFREAHSLKGAARMLGLSAIEIVAHGLESVLNTARKEETPLTDEAIGQMNASLRELRKLVQDEFGTASAPPAQEMALSTPAGMPLAAPASPPQQQDTGPTAPAGSTSAPPATQTTPSAETPSSRPAFDTPFRIETVRVETRKLDDLLTLAGELSVIQGRGLHRLSLLDDMLDHWAALERSRRKLHLLLRKPGSTAKAEEAMQQMLQTDGASLAQIVLALKQARDAFHEDGARFESAVNTLEERVHAARLLPLSTLFSLFPRMARELARELGKEVELTLEGGDISVDKRIIEEMKDPLMHLLRNAVDHGIEPPEERERQGKPRCGTLLLRAERGNNSVLLEIRDDGRGLDIEAIRHVALQRGLHDEATLAAMSAAQLQQLIFLPGFSTSRYITELSGRGVGLDVVRVNVERLKGDIRLESAAQRGTAMQLRLPLGLSTTRLLLVSVAGRRYGLPVEFVQTSQRVHAEDLFTLEGRPAFDLAGQAIIAPRLADLLELPAADSAGEAPSPAAGWTACIVIRVGNEWLGLRVDELLDEEEVLAKPLGAPLQRVRNVSALAILGNGDICTVLNPSDLLRSAHKLDLRAVPDKVEQPHPRTRPVILLAEDTMLVRVMEKRILEDAGYEVVAAVDGMDAFNALGSRSFAAVVSDIMMPNMDGLTLTARIRQEPRYRELPVILVTSLSSDEDKRRGLEAGANAYIPKPSFDQRVLLDTLQRLIVP